MTKFSLAVHGGAGTILRHTMTDDLEARYHAGLRRALQAGHDVLAHAGSAMDAVTAAVCVLEDDPLFNAGRGAVFTSDGRQEMDAAVMDGATRKAGAVAGVMGPRNPILAARSVMERTDHVLLIGPNALQVARDAGLRQDITPCLQRAAQTCVIAGLQVVGHGVAKDRAGPAMHCE